MNWDHVEGRSIEREVNEFERELNGRRSGWPWLVFAAATLAGFLAQSEFAHTVRTALGFVLAVFLVTFLVSLAHSMWWRVGEPLDDLGQTEADNTETRTEALPR